MKKQNSPTQQRGLSLWGMLIVLLLIAFFALVAIKVIPVYLNQMKVAASIKEVSTDPSLNPNSSVHAIRDALQRHWDVESISDIKASQVEISHGNDGQVLSYDYEARRHLFYNIYIVIDFEGQRTLTGGS